MGNFENMQDINRSKRRRIVGGGGKCKNLQGYTMEINTTTTTFKFN